MRFRYLAFSAALFFAGCTAYKQLQPKPALSPAEAGYIELKDGKNSFVLKKDKKYFIQFPSPQEDNFYLVLDVPSKKQFNTVFTSKLIEKKRFEDPVTDESNLDTLCLYPIMKNSAGYYLLLDKIPQPVNFSVNYRYTPQWRYKFETKHSEFLEILAKNRVDRAAYNSIGGGSHLEGINYFHVADTVKNHTTELEKLLRELLAIEDIFPSSIINSADKAYENYKKLKADLEEELRFQNSYALVLSFFGKEAASRGNSAELVKSVDLFIDFFKKKDTYPSTIFSEAQSVIGGRLAEVAPFYDQRLTGKEDSKPLDPELYMLEPLYQIENLYELAGIAASPEYKALTKFTKDFDARSTLLRDAKDSLNALESSVKKLETMPSNDFFPPISRNAATIKSTLQRVPEAASGKYQNYRCATLLDQDLADFSSKIDTAIINYQQAETLVPQLNVFKDQKAYSAMLGTLKQYPHLPFLLDKYRLLDKMSVEQQGNDVEEALNQQRWSSAEDFLRKLHDDINFLNPPQIMPMKKAVVDELEDSLYTKIDRVSRVRINKFLEENIGQLNNVDSHYGDSVFVPVYNVTFSSGSRAELAARKEALVNDLKKMRADEFPAKAIKLLFDEFTRNPGDNGVLKARAIVTHGKYYEGDKSGPDKKIQQRIYECDPNSAKWIVKAKEYRRVFALPVTNSRKGKNKYLVRFIIDIETEANFPVYDINIKLPKEIAENAAAEQWYDKIALNKKELKNEGRFSITAPSAANAYECQISPVQMNKGKGNVL
ncbi:MAG TPA: hypothetical protein VHO70_22410, partial [Chitinispirillaceae bacterium]|nr:hypothetical protein [Chitinispirillaceae bacterium]